jgi:serine phosphatase RsbU (regulator of sigma subunit)
MEPAPAASLTQLQVSQYLEQLLHAIPVGVDALVMYTDGLTEAGAPRMMLGEEGLRQVLARCVGLSASDICASIDEVLLTWQSERGHRDDCAALVLRVPPETRASS